MLRLAKNLNLHRIVFKPLRRHTEAATFGASVVVFAVGASAQTPSREQPPAKNKIPDLASAEFGWLAGAGEEGGAPKKVGKAKK